MEIVTSLSKFFQSLSIWMQIGWALSLFLFIGMSCLALISWSISNHERNESELTRIIYPELKSLRRFLSKKVETPGGNYFDPAAYRDYFETGNNLLEQAKLSNPALFKNLKRIPMPESSKTTDFDGRGYFTKGQFRHLIETVDRMLALIEESDKSS